MTMLQIKQLGITDYAETLNNMQQYTKQRNELSDDQIWITEHPPVYTQGLNGKAEHILTQSPIPIVQTDRGGQVTYHGPGQLIIYFLVNLVRKKIGVKQCVNRIETIIIKFLQQYNIDAYAKADAPGVYVNEAKISALGLKIRKGCSYHGLSLNNDMDLSPFNAINPCGYKGLQITQLKDFGIQISQQQLSESLIPIIKQEFNYA
ncbi:MAG: lipoyl(octanoyl) transferase LipB [Gammaproteobacteria bacterium]|nr:lipoyl(octanoyl) transferase LipB [Gammaproteobacteria bacterium]